MINFTSPKIMTENSQPNKQSELDLELVKQAKLLFYDERKQILLGFRELDLQSYLKELFSSMEPSYLIQVTQGTNELGKDLVLIKKDRFTTDVIGVVVKLGDVKGKLLGEVDEVIEKVNAFSGKELNIINQVNTQIKQSFRHEAEVKDALEKYKVNKVVVIISGEISSEGRTRIVKEVDVSEEYVHGINWLVEKFTEFYPQVFFDGKVTTFLQKKIQELESKHIAAKSNKMLSECFIEPLVQSSDITVDFKESLEAVWNRKKLPFSKLKSIITKQKPVILIGDPGTGKSAALSKLAIDLMKDVYKSAVTKKDKTEKCSIPILITARQLLDSATSQDLLNVYFEEAEITKNISVKSLLIDGLDEVNSSIRSEAIEKSKKFAEEFGSSLILATRKVDIVKITPVGFEKLELLPFGAGQALALIEKINSGKEVLSVLRKGLERIKSQIPMVPLSLILLIDIVEEHKEIPASVTELYERYNDSVLGRYDKNKGIEVLFEYLIKKRFLSSLAFYEFIEEGLVEITRQKFDEFVDRYAEKYNRDEDYLRKFISEIERAGILQIGEETVLFRHRSFLDYFAGFFAYDRHDEIDDLNQFIVDKYFDDDAGETSFFYIGLKRAISEKLLNKILDYENTSLIYDLDKILIGHLLQAGWDSETNTKLLGIEKSFRYAQIAKPKFYKFAEKDGWIQPKIMSDLLLLVACEFSLRSGFLDNELLKIYYKYKDEKHEEFFFRLSIFWVAKPYLEAAEIKSQIENLLNEISDSATLTDGEKVRYTMILGFIDSRDKVLTKPIRKKIDKIYDQYPKELYKLLPDNMKKNKFLPPVKK